MTKPSIREMGPEDRETWAWLYDQIFPGLSLKGRLSEIDRVIATPDAAAYVAEEGGVAIGFAEYACRAYANGCNSKPVPFLEAIWVAETARRQGLARALITTIEDRVRAEGHREMGSDVDLDNDLGLTAHRGLGFEETERVVYFRKDL